MLDYNLILDAAQRLKKKVRRTELIHAQHFSERLGLPLYFKCENLQRTGAFKIRGALNFMTSQSRSALAGGVITASAGNHAQGVAFSADLLGVKATVYMPESTPPQKVFATRDYGANVVLQGKNFDEACGAALGGGERRAFRAPLQRPAGHGRSGHHRPRAPRGAPRPGQRAGTHRRRR